METFLLSIWPQTKDLLEHHRRLDRLLCRKHLMRLDIPIFFLGTEKDQHWQAHYGRIQRRKTTLVLY